jgi:PIN domain nuclease of toxin-antitoxin system
LIICDTHVLVFDALAPARLSARARRLIREGEQQGRLACADISLWEIAMLASRGRITVPLDTGVFIQTVLDARAYRVLPITAEVAALSQSAQIPQKDPGDRLIAATALAYGAQMLSADPGMKKIPQLRVVW